MASRKPLDFSCFGGTSVCEATEFRGSVQTSPTQEKQMATPAESRQQVQFAEFSLDLRTGELWRDGKNLVLAYQSFQILAALLRRPGALVTREELVKRLWASDVFVDFEGSLNKAIKRLRETLLDSADHPRFIETLPRRGYRFMAAVAITRDPAAETKGVRSARKFPTTACWKSSAVAHGL